MKFKREHKVEAKPMSKGAWLQSLHLYTVPEEATIEGYVVDYPKYDIVGSITDTTPIWWSKQEFEDTFKPDEHTNIADALAAVDTGQVVTRAGWCTGVDDEGIPTYRRVMKQVKSTPTFVGILTQGVEEQPVRSLLLEDCRATDWIILDDATAALYD